MSDDRLTWAVASFERWGTPSLVRAALERHASLEEVRGGLDPDALGRVDVLVEHLRKVGVGAVRLGDGDYPQRLAVVASAPPVLFWLGNINLATTPAVGMCGSRDASDEGLAAARICGEQVAAQGLTVVSGYARGVDMETHVGALRAGGNTIIVLAEGIIHFRMKSALKEAGTDMDRILILSQFPPRQTWNAGAAMARNAVIVGLGRALVVIEARDKGGTLDAGLQALRMRRPLLALEFATGAPQGNALLFEKGAKRVSTPGELKAVLDQVGEPASQMPLTLPV